MTKDAFDRAVSNCALLPQGLLQYAVEASQSMTDSGRNELWKTLEQEYSQFVPFVQRKLERMHSVLSEVEERNKPRVARPVEKEHKDYVGVLR
jgi:hypothetical protein